MAEQFLYLTTTGRTTGEPRRIEIWYVEHRGCYYLVSELREGAQWVKNLMADARVTFSVGSRDDETATLPGTRASAGVIRRDDQPELARTVSALMDDKYGWSDGLIVELTPHGSSS